MNKPEKLAFSDYATFRLFRAEIMIYFGILISVFIVALVDTGGPVKEMVLPGAAMGGIGLVLIGVFAAAAWIYRLVEKSQIKRMFAGEIWECWQFSAQEWQAQVEGVCNLISPEDEGIKAYMGAVYSSIIGAVFSIILILVGFFAVDDPILKRGMWFTSLVVFLLFLGAGLFQPLVEKNKANRYRSKALKTKEPRVWFGPDGIYHETLGHTTLKGLFKVTDQTKSRRAIQFKRQIKTDDSDDLDIISSPVPSGCEERAGRLVRRYREEIIQR